MSSAGAPERRRLASDFESVLAGLPDAVIAVDDALRVVFWNAAAEVLVERSARRPSAGYSRRSSRRRLAGAPAVGDAGHRREPAERAR